MINSSTINQWDWKLVSEEAPCSFGEQADIMFWVSGWPIPLSGLVTNFGTLEEWTARTGKPDNWKGQYNWMLYNQQDDRYSQWDGPEPTHWCRTDIPVDEESIDAQGLLEFRYQREWTGRQVRFKASDF